MRTLSRIGGSELFGLCADLWPVPRGLMGDSNRRYLDALTGHLDLQIGEVSSGEQVLDWVVPEDWTLHRATLRAPDGTMVADTAIEPLSVVGHSHPFHGVVDRRELDRHLHSLPEQPDLTPWRTTYYARDWGFCLPHRIREALPDGEYRVEIEAEVAPGTLSYGVAVIPGHEAAEILVSSHTCHPRMANDNVSGNVVALATALALGAEKPRYTYRFLFAPGTIGAIAWLASETEAIRQRTIGGLVLSGVGDHGPSLTYKRSRRSDSVIDRSMGISLRDREGPSEIRDFQPWGYDERQFNTPGMSLGVGLLNRTPFGSYPEYHTSADDLDFLAPESLADSLDTVLSAIEIVETNARFESTVAVGEPQLGRYDLYESTGGRAADDSRMATLWNLSLADGGHDLIEVASRSGLPYRSIAESAQRLEAAGLIRQLNAVPVT